jgi:lipopolysaccharide transport system permease protein
MSLYEYRELIKNLVISDLKVKYSNSILGFAWSMLNPMLMMIVLYFVFSNLYHDKAGLAQFLLIGLFSWRFFANGTTMAMGSIVGKSSLVNKVYIPREVLTLSSALSSLVSSFLEFIAMIPIIILAGTSLSLTFVLFPLVHVLYFIVIYGISLFLASLYVYYRDLNQIWEVIIQIGFFVCPVIYDPQSVVPKQYLPYYMLNPITVLIGMYRDIFIYGTIPTASDFLIVIAFGAVLVVAGTMTFNKLSRRFAEEV